MLMTVLTARVDFIPNGKENIIDPPNRRTYIKTVIGHCTYSKRYN